MGADCCGKDDPYYQEINTEQQNDYNYNKYGDDYGIENSHDVQLQNQEIKTDEYETKYDDLNQQYQAEIEEKLKLTNQIQQLTNQVNECAELKAANIKLQQQINQMSEYKDTYIALQDENKKLIESAQKFEDEIKRLKQIIVVSRNDSSANTTIESLQKEINSLQSELDKMNTLKMKNNELSNLIDAMSEQQKTDKQMLKVLNEENKQSEQEIADYKSKLIELQKKITEQSKNAMDELNKSTDVNLRFEQQKIKLQQQMNEISGYKDTSIALQQENEKLIETAQKLEDEIKRLNQIITDSRNDSSANTAIEKLQSELKSMQTKLDKMNLLKQKNNELSNLIDTMYEKQNTDKQMLKTLNEESYQSEQEIADYKSKLIELQKKFDEQPKVTMMELNKSKDSALRFEQQMTEYNEYKAKTEAWQQQNDEMAENANKLKEQIVNLTNEIDKYKRKKNENDAKFLDLQSQIEALEKEKAKMSSLQTTNEKLNKTIEELKNAKNAEIEKYRNKQVEIQKEVEQLELKQSAKFNDMNAQILTLKAAQTMLQQKLEKEKNNSQQMEQEKEALKKLLDEAKKIQLQGIDVSNGNDSKRNTGTLVKEWFRQTTPEPNEQLEHQPNDTLILHDQFGDLPTRHRNYGVPTSKTTKVFGVDPAELECTMIDDKDYGAAIPNILIKLKQELFANNGHLMEGIFRKSPNKDKCKQIEEKLDDGQMENIKWQNIKSELIANLIKTWFMKLPNPILHDSKVPKSDIASFVNEKLDKMKKALLSFLLDLCVDIIKYENQNKMTIKEMAKAISPIIYKLETVKDPIKSMRISMTMLEFMEAAIIWRINESDTGHMENGLNQMPLRKRNYGFSMENIEQKEESEESLYDLDDAAISMRQTRRVALSLIDESKQFEKYEPSDTKLSEKEPISDQKQMNGHEEKEQSGPQRTRNRTSGISKSVNKKVFGVDPNELNCTIVKDKDYGAAIPNILIKLKQELFANNGHLIEGIFRKAPNKEDCTQIEEKLDDGQMEIIQWHKVSCHIMANLIKVWYRKLPQPILQNIKISKIENFKKSNNPNDAQLIINELTKLQKSLLLYLLDLCVEIIKHKDVNKMTAKNMAIVCAPNLYDPSNAADPMKAMLLTSNYSKFVELAIELRQKTQKEEKEEENENNGLSQRSRHIGYAEQTGALVDFEENSLSNDHALDQNNSLDINNIYQSFASGHAMGNLSTMNGINGLNNLEFDDEKSPNGIDELQRLVSSANPNLSSHSDNDSDDIFAFTADDY